MVWILLAIPSSGSTQPRRDPEISAILINGGAKPKANFLSHFEHLEEMRAALISRGVAADRIAVFNSDGGAPGPDMAARASIATPPEHWLVAGTQPARALRPQVELLDTQWQGVALRPASKAALRAYVLELSARLEPGDTLLVYVTDHGRRGKEDLDNGTISLWRETLSVREFREIMGPLNRDVRIVMMMSQCYSGTFASVMYPGGHGLPSGETCGVFSTTRDRRAYGCYPEGRSQQRVGHAYTLIDALAQETNLETAQDRTSLRDRSPDVPLRTSEVFVEKVLAALAARTNTSLIAATDGLLTRAWATPRSWSRQLDILDDLGQQVGLLSPRSLGEARDLIRSLEGLVKEVHKLARRWQRSFDQLRGANLGHFLDHHPEWVRRLRANKVAPLTVDQRRTVLADLVTAVSAWTHTDPVTSRLLETFHRKTRLTRQVNYRMEVRLAVALRMRAALLDIAGRSLLKDSDERVPTDERRALEALLACEAFEPPAAPRPRSMTALRAFPPLPEELQTLSELRPAFLGVEYRPLSPSARRGRHLPPGAVEIRAVVDDSPGARAELKPGDIAVGTGRHDFEDINALRNFVMTSSQGASIRLRIVRGKRSLRRSIKLTPWPVEPVAVAASSRVGQASPELDGLVFRGPAPNLRGKRHVLFFWQPGRGDSRAALARLGRWAEQSGVAVVAISDASSDTLDGVGGTTTVFALDPARRSFRRHGVSASPTLVWVDAKGIIRHRRAGLPTDFDLTRWDR